ncbi:Flp pilus assembly protein CpaB [Petroclostridium sp. X23]|uniref:Flp pilus assembly protein CpaB n=1 Tax=Petroclostridium sp. X23 TaxID=3045146 RepID=UPI0024AD2EE1|nr:Flp pilus assembly protein CpaB [Petroclostridium sp. X23]WHH60538.1 Flp pilus assembly protein CpaB [Petroclostridium sp. X23]
MHRVNKKVLFLAILLAAITSFLIYSYIRGIEKSDIQTEYSYIVAAAKTVESRAEILSNDIKMIKVETTSVNPQAFTNMNDIIGKRARSKIIEGEQILKDRIATEEQMLLSYVIPEGKRAITVNVNEASEVGDFIRPGDHVDILVTFDKYELENNVQKIIYPRVTKVVLQDILVLGMGQLQEVPEKPRQELPKTVTLAVTLEEAEKLTFIEETAVIKMVLRNVDDHNKVTTSGALREDMVTDRGKIVLPK